MRRSIPNNAFFDKLLAVGFRARPVMGATFSLMIAEGKGLKK